MKLHIIITAASSLLQCPRRSRSSFSVSCCLGTNASDSGESLHCFLVGVNKSYAIATSDLGLFIHASNLLPSLATPLPYITMTAFTNYLSLYPLTGRRASATQRLCAKHTSPWTLRPRAVQVPLSVRHRAIKMSAMIIIIVINDI